MPTDILLVFALILLNGLFAMSVTVIALSARGSGGAEDACAGDSDLDAGQTSRSA